MFALCAILTFVTVWYLWTGRDPVQAKALIMAAVTLGIIGTFTALMMAITGRR